jgi:hypothetical protein
MEKMRNTYIDLFGQRVNTSITTLKLDMIPATAELKQLLKLKHLRRLRLSMSNIKDEGIRIIAAHPTLEDLNLQFTAVTDRGIGYLTTMPSLRYLRLKECDEISNASSAHFNAMPKLEDLAIQDANVDLQGLMQLANPKLRFLCIDDWQVKESFTALKQLSIQLPDCEITVKGKGIIYNGEFDGTW